MKDRLTLILMLAAMGERELTRSVKKNSSRLFLSSVILSMQ